MIRRRRGGSPLNPYVAMADVMINLLLIFSLVILVSSRVEDAYYQSKEREVQRIAAVRPALWREHAAFYRQGPTIAFRFRTGSLFAGPTARLSPGGARVTADLAAVLGSPGIRERAEGVDITVTHTPESPAALAYAQARALRDAVRPGLRSVRITSSGRTQDYAGGAKAPTNDVDVVVKMRAPGRTLPRGRELPGGSLRSDQ